MIPSPHTHAVSEDYIPYPVRIKVTQIDPRLDYILATRLVAAFRPNNAATTQKCGTAIIGAAKYPLG
jgi:hypothetical protein